MENLFQAALEAVAHAGDGGLAVTELWNLLVRPAKDLGLAPLFPRLHEPIWKQLLSHPDDLCFKTTGGSSRELNPSSSPPELASAAAAEAAGIKIAASIDLQDASTGVYGRRLLRFALSDVQRKVLSLLSAARHNGLLQNELAGKVNVQPNNFFYVVKGLEERGLIVKRQAVMRQNKTGGARGGKTGVTVSTNLIHLAKYAPTGLGETSRITDGRSSNMMGGVPLLPSGVPSTTTAAGTATTAAFTTAVGTVAGGTQTEPAWQSDDEGNGNAEDDEGIAAAAAAASSFSFQVVDDDAMLLRITSQLAALENGTALERDLKGALGFSAVTGHRQWRRLRGLLLRKGCIQQFLGYHGADKVSSFVRLEKPWAAAEGAWAADGDMDPTLRNILDPFGRMETRGRKVTELTIDRQVLTMIAAAGEAGVTSNEVDTALRLNMKRNSARLDDLQDRFAKAGKDFKVYETAISQGRSILKRYNATPALADALAGQLEGEGVAPRAPDGGWVAEVMDAAAAGLGASEIAEILRSASQPAGDIPVPGVGGVAAGGAAANGADSSRGGVPAAQGATAAGAAPTAVVATKNKKKQNNKRRATAAATAADNIDSEDSDGNSNEDGKDIDGCESEEHETESEDEGGRQQQQRGRGKQAKKAKQPPRPPSGAAAVTRKKITTEIGRLRRHWLVEKVLQEGMLLSSEVGRYLQTAERSAGNPTAVMPDRKVFQRVINTAVAAGEITTLQVSMPGVHGSLEQRQVSVIARPGTSLEQPGFVDAVFERNRDLQKRVRNVTHLRRQAQQAEAAGVTIPTVAVQALPRLADHGASLKETRFKLLLSNGYVSARMVRVRLMHDATWRYVSSRGGPSTAMDSSLVEAAAEGRAFLVGRSPDAAATSLASVLSSSSRPDIGVFSATSEQTALVVTADELWRGMTVGTFLSCLGSRCEDAAAMARFQQKKDKALGTLSAKELEILAGGTAALVQARSQITRLFDIFHRMGLVSAIVPFGANVVGVASSLQGGNAAAYLLRPTAHYEEPQEIIERPPNAPNGAGATESDLNVADGEGLEGAQQSQQPLSTRVPPKREMLDFDVSSDRGREAYWLSMQFMVMCSPAAAAARVRSSDAPSLVLECFPFVYAREAASDRSWVERNGCTGAQIQAVRPLLKREAPNGVSAAAEMTWERALAMSRQLEVPFEAVARALTIQRGLESSRSTGQKSSRRLGGLGRRVGGGGGGIRVRRSRRRAQSDEEDEEEEDYGELENLEFGIAGRSRSWRLPPERKRKWHAEEDRQLLHAWARWLAMHGPDKILRWGFIRDRPPETKGVSCRYRLQTLKRHSEMGPLVMKVRELASGVHSRKVLRAADSDGAEGGAVEGVDQERGEGPAMEPENSSIDEELPSISRRGTHQKRRRGAEGDDGGGAYSAPASKRSRSAAAAEQFGVENLPRLFEIFDEEDAEALRQVCSEIEDVVRSAPNRHKTRPIRIAHRSRNALTVFGRALGPWSRGPVPGSNSAPGRALSQLRQWARSAAAARAIGAVAPAPAVAAAMELAKSLLHPTTPRDADSATALKSRFSEEEIRDAFLLLAKLGHVTAPSSAPLPAAAALPSTSGAAAAAVPVPVFSLSRRFASETEPLFVPGRVFPEANATLFELKRRGVHGSALPAAQHGGSPSAGTVAALLSLGTTGSAQLRFEIPQEWHMQILSSTADDDVAKDELMHLLAGVKVKASLAPDAGGGAGGSDAMQMDGAGGASNASDSVTGIYKYSSQQQVFYQPSLVAVNATLRSDAEKACKKAFTSKKIAGGARSMTVLLHAVRSAASDGLTPAACAAALPTNTSKKAISEAIETLCRYGLARKVAAYDDSRLVAAEASQGLLAFPPPTPTAEASKVKEMESALAPLNLPAPGTLQPLADVPLRPWVDHHGHLNRSLWEDLARRVVCTALHCPGIAGDVLLQSIRVVNPQDRRELLGALCAAGVLRAETASEDSSAAKKASTQSVFAACFGDAIKQEDTDGGGSGGGGAENQQAVGINGATVEEEVPPVLYGDASLWNYLGGNKGDECLHFFAEPGKCWQLAGVQPPQVILGGGVYNSSK